MCVCACVCVSPRLQAYSLYKDYKGKGHPLIERVTNKGNLVMTEWEEGYMDRVPRAREDGTWTKVADMPGCNGTPPMIYGAVWNPLRPQVRGLGDTHTHIGTHTHARTHTHTHTHGHTHMHPHACLPHAHAPHT